MNFPFVKLYGNITIMLRSELIVFTGITQMIVVYDLNHQIENF